MKKILLIEDRKTRQHGFLNNINLDLNSYSDVLENKIGEEYKKFYEKIKIDNFDFSEYILVISHKNAFNGDTQKVIFNITKECKDKNIPMVLFSGGVSCSSYRKDDQEEILELDSKDFYSKNLELFLKNYQDSEKIELQILNYGDKWKLNIILNIIEKINIFISENEKDEDILYDEFVNFTSFDLLKSTDFNHESLEIEDGWIYLNEIKKVAKSLNTYLNESIIYEK